MNLFEWSKYLPGVPAWYTLRPRKQHLMCGRDRSGPIREAAVAGEVVSGIASVVAR